MIYTVRGVLQKRYNNPQGNEWLHLVNSIHAPAQYVGTDFNLTN